MQVEVKNAKQKIEIDENYRGLLVSKDGDLWLVCRDGAVCFGNEETVSSGPLSYNSHEWVLTIETEGPFTEFDGELILRN